MLRTALRSVAAQTALSSIAEVVVIENLSDRESEKVCREFSQLPIRYIFRDPPIPPGFDSAKDALRYINSDYLAILFDDDWWGDQHLEKSIESHSFAPGVAASYGTCVWTNGEDGYLTGIHSSFVPWFAAENPKLNGKWILGISELLVAGLLKTSFHFSSLLVSRRIWETSLECIRDGNPFDTDRLISVEFGRHGNVVMDTTPRVFIRMHESQESRRIGGAELGQYWWNKTTEKLLRLAKESDIDLMQEFSKRMQSKSVSGDQLRGECDFSAVDHLDKVGILKKVPLYKKILRQTLPPFLRSLANSIRY